MKNVATRTSSPAVSSAGIAESSAKAARPVAVTMPSMASPSLDVFSEM